MSAAGGEVYRATDTNLKRAVAIKVLPEALAFDVERLARFQREAEVLAALNHPNIAHIHGLERADAMSALVMELVEGPTWAATAPTQLFEGRYVGGPGRFANPGRTYDVSPDGGRFLMIKEDERPASGQAVPLHLVVVQNWTEELKRLVPMR